MGHGISESDLLRVPERVYEPDPWTHYFVLVNKRTGETQQKIIEDQYDAIAVFQLNDTVPKEVSIHFETAKNLYFYAWFVYRFYPVAEQQAITSLEFALRERFPDFVIAEKNKHPRKMEPGLKKLMEYTIDNGFVRNDDFSARERWARIHAKERYSFQKRHEALNAGLDRWVEDDSEIVVTQEDLDYDWLRDFLEIIPKVRNLYAHGTFHLYPAPVCRTFEMVSEIINQLYPKR